jgi:hypothetical protein
MACFLLESNRSGFECVGPQVRLEPVAYEGMRPYDRAVSKLQVLTLLDVGSTPENPEPSSPSLKWWRRRELKARNSCEFLNDSDLLLPFVRVIVRVAWDGSVK